MRKRKKTHTQHSSMRIFERAFGATRTIAEALNTKRDTVGLPRQTNNKRVTAILIEGEWVVAIWSKTTGDVITVIKLKDYAGRSKIPDSAREEMKIIENKRRAK